jgi:hypothetical protein
MAAQVRQFILVAQYKIVTLARTHFVLTYLSNHVRT